MAHERQTAKEAALSAFAHSAEAILHFAKQAGAAHAAAAIEVLKPTIGAVGAVVEGDWDRFSVKTAEASLALLNTALDGGPGVALGFNDAVNALARLHGDGSGGITSEEVLASVLPQLSNKLSDTAFELFNSKDVPNVRVMPPPVDALATPALPPLLTRFPINEAIRDIAKQASAGNEMTFEQEVITLPRRTASTVAPTSQTPSGVSVIVSAGIDGHELLSTDTPGTDTPTFETWPANYSLEIRTFHGHTRGLSVDADAEAVSRATVLVSPATAAAGAVREHASRGGLQAPQAAIQVRQVAQGATYDFTLANAAGQQQVNAGIRSQITITQQPNAITLSASFAGDPRMAHEIIVRDTAGTGIVIGAHMPSTGAGASSADWSGSLTLKAAVDQAGRFNGPLSATLTDSVGKTVARFNEVHDSLAASRDLWTWNHTTLRTLTPADRPAPQITPRPATPAPESRVTISPLVRH